MEREQERSVWKSHMETYFTRHIYVINKIVGDR